MRGLVFLCFALALMSCSAPNSKPADAIISAVYTGLPIDKDIVKGRLNNGLEYFIRENSKPENFAELRLIVKTGSIFEDDSQQGFAHFAEHMAFNGTTDFEAQEIIAFVESIGMKFGAHLNATTSFDNTIYQLRVPTDDPKVIETAIHILQNWASKITFDEKAVNEERGVVLEEWRSRKGVSERIAKQQWPVMFAGTNYAQRLPIGTEALIMHGKQNDLVRFYQTWYRPDLMAVVAVGDFKSTDIESLIKRYFSPLNNPDTPALKNEQFLSQNSAPIVNIFTDKELTSTSLSSSWRLVEDIDNNTHQAYRARVIKNLLSGILSKRINDKSLDTESAFTAAQIGFNQIIPSAESFYFNASVKPGRIEEAFASLLTEIKRAVDYGVSAQELATEKRLYIEWFESTLKSQNTISHNAYVNSYLSHFLNGAPLTSIEQDFVLSKDILNELSRDDLQQQMKKWAKHQNAIIFVSAPENSALPLPSNEDLLQVWKSVQSSKTLDFVDRAQVSTLLSTLPQPGAVLNKSYIEKWDAHEWLLSNGVKVVLKPTKFTENAISFKAISKGGYALVDDETYLTTFGMIDTLNYMGLGDLDMEQFTQFSRGKRFSVNPSVNDYTESMSGSSNKQDLLYMMQSIFLRFTAPVKDQERFEWLKDNYRPRLANKYNNPNAQFFAAIQAKTQGGNPRNVEFDVGMLNKQNLDTIYTLYKERFANAADFTFVFVGDMDLAQMEDFLTLYIASLPTTQKYDPQQKLPNYAMQGEYQIHMKKGLEEKASVIVSLFGDASWSYQNQLVMQAFENALENDLRTRLREELGAVYSVGVNAQLSRWPYQNYGLTVSFTCNPERIDELYQEVQGVFAKLISGDISSEQLQNFKTQMLTSREKNMKENHFWLNHILAHYTEFAPLPPQEYAPLVKSLTVDMLVNAAKQYLQTQNILYATLQPEDAEEAKQTTPDERYNEQPRND